MSTFHVQSAASRDDSAPARSRRRRRTFAIALAAAASAVGLVAAEPAAAATPRPAVRSEAPTDTAATPVCDRLWDRILVLGLPEQAWPSVAAWLGFAQSGEWLSADGLAWEHFDGRVVVVATPRTHDGEAGPAGCRVAIAAADTAQHSAARSRS